MVDTRQPSFKQAGLDAGRQLPTSTEALDILILCHFGLNLHHSEYLLNDSNWLLVLPSTSGVTNPKKIPVELRYLNRKTACDCATYFRYII